MKLEQVFTYVATVKKPVTVGVGPYGYRDVVEIESGEVTGERISGKLTQGANWVLRGEDGIARNDIRYTLETDDGAAIYVQMQGIAEASEAAAAAFAGTGPDTSFDEVKIRLSVTMETGDPRYEWVNREVFVCETRVLAKPGVECRVYRLA